ncbi:phosphatase phospho-type [Syncephalastrum racemosum]|uniref:Phosphatase phospho-type n=1 Tax=Syncephalastrum racemosum TaxID=13706 RepID=A0A1X2HDD7_SYNRA|nr:phosphatase phospho-type [Syncephalastrum racemosum]
MSSRDLAVFDFDWTVIEADSDDTVLNAFINEEWKKSRATTQWTDLMDEALVEIQKSHSLQEIDAVLQSIPLVPMARETLNTLRANGADIVILSDANDHFIKTILKAHGLYDHITSIITNPSYIDDQGRLRIKRRIPADAPPHGCSNACAVNICKGRELDQYMMAQEHLFNRVMYSGDGKNDFCPGTRLKKSDLYFVRMNKRLAAMLLSDPQAADKLQVPVTYWNDYTPILDALAGPQRCAL